MVTRTRYLPLATLGDGSAVDVFVDCAAWSYRQQNLFATTYVNGLDTLGLWAGQDGVAVDLPAIRVGGLYVPYHQTLRVQNVLALPTARAIGSFRFIDMPLEAMRNDLVSQVTFLDLSGAVGAGVVFEQRIRAHAVSLRIFTYDAAVATMDGVLLADLAAANGGVSLDWPPMYGPDGELVLHDMLLRFIPGPAQFIQGAFTLVDVVPTR